MSALSHSSVRRLAGAMAVALAALTSTARAQIDDKDCSHAAKIISKGHPEKKEEWAFSTIMQCGTSGGSALATGLLALRSETDTAALGNFMFAADEWADAGIYQAAVSIAQDNGASFPARIFAIRHLLRLIYPSMLFDYGDLSAPLTDPSTMQPTGCVGVLRSDVEITQGRALPSTYASDVNALGRSIVANAGTPPGVRNAAQCLAIATPPDGSAQATRKRPGTPSRRP